MPSCAEISTRRSFNLRAVTVAASLPPSGSAPSFATDTDALATLDLALPAPAAPVVSKGAIAQARQPLGSAPLEHLFSRTARAWCTQDAGHHNWKGLSLWGMDGTTFRTPDSADNRARFGAQSYASGKVAGVVNVGDDGDIADRTIGHGEGLNNQRRDSTTPCCAATCPRRFTARLFRI